MKWLFNLLTSDAICTHLLLAHACNYALFNCCFQIPQHTCRVFFLQCRKFLLKSRLMKTLGVYIDLDSCSCVARTNVHANPSWIVFYLHINFLSLFLQSGLISSKGYPVQDFEVPTEDGFLLGMQRIPHGRNNSHLRGQWGQGSVKIPILCYFMFLEVRHDTSPFSL